MIAQISQQAGGSVRAVCAALELPRSSFYHAAVPTPTQSADAELGPLIEAIFKRHRRRYGYRRIGEELSDRGVVCAPARIRRLMALILPRITRTSGYATTEHYRNGNITE